MLGLLAYGSALLALAAAQDGTCSPVSFLQRSSYTSYAALGDSYAAGLGSLSRLKACDDNDPASPDCTTSGENSSIYCNKDTGSYAWQFAKTYMPTGDFEFPACSGADTSAVLQQQLKFVHRDLDLVTLQVGGDDYSTFANVILNCLKPQGWTWIGLGDCPGAVRDAFKEFETILTNVRGVLSQVNATVSPATTKALVGYAQFFGQEQDCTIEIDYPLIWGFIYKDASPSLKNRQLVNNLVATANRKLIYAAAEYGFLFINADPQFETHRWCDVQSPWWIIQSYYISGSDTAQKPYREVAVGHPSFDGQQAYLRALTSALRLS